MYFILYFGFKLDIFNFYGSSIASVIPVIFNFFLGVFTNYFVIYYVNCDCYYSFGSVLNFENWVLRLEYAIEFYKLIGKTSDYIINLGIS